MKLYRHFIYITILILTVAAAQQVQSEEPINEVFLLEKQDKLLAFSGMGSKWFPKDLRTGEKVVGSASDGNVAIAYTNERALAFSAITNRWVEESFRIRETVISMTAKGNVGTIVTDVRALGFSANSGLWVESVFNIGK